jgi:hypothetical protein
MMAAENGELEVEGVPAIGTPILFAEFMVGLRKHTGVAQSRAAYPLPSDATAFKCEELS